MSPDTADKLIWLGKVCQLVAAIILTPEIIGPDRFERLEEFIESRDASNSLGCYIVLILAVFGPFLCLTTVFTGLMRMEYVSESVSRVLFLFLLLLPIGLVAFLSLMDEPGKILVELFDRVIAWLTAYLRRVSLFRTVAVTGAVVLFFFGIGLELVLEWPF